MKYFKDIQDSMTNYFKKYYTKEWDEVWTEK